MPLASSVRCGGHVELREHQLAQLLTGDPLERLVLGDEVLLDQLVGDPEGRRGGPLADPGLQHPQLAALDRELDVAQVAVVGLQAAHDLTQLGERGGVELVEVGERQRVADARHDVLALRVLQVVAVVAGHAGGGVTREADAGAGVVAEVAEHHGHDVDRGAEVVRDALAAAVQPGAVGVPRVEDGLDGQVQLLARVLRELPAGLLEHDRLELGDELAQVVGGQAGVGRDAPGLLLGVQRVGEPRAVDVEHRLAEHLDQSAVGVPREARVAGERGEALDRAVVQADVQDGLHHARHGELGAGAHRDQQRVVEVAERATEGVLELAQRPA